MIIKNKDGQFVNVESVNIETSVSLENLQASIDYHKSHIETHTKLLEKDLAMYAELNPLAEADAKEKAEAKAKAEAEALAKDKAAMKKAV